MIVKQGDFSQSTKLNANFPVGNPAREGICAALSALWVARRMTVQETPAARLNWLGSDPVFYGAAALQKFYEAAIKGVTSAQLQADPMSAIDANEQGKAALLAEMNINFSNPLAIQHFDAQVPASVARAVQVAGAALGVTNQYALFSFNFKPKGGHCTAAFCDASSNYTWFDPNIGEYSAAGADLPTLLESISMTYMSAKGGSTFEPIDYKVHAVKATGKGATTLVPS